jgi:probable F420-dependent oxidoreductase
MKIDTSLMFDPKTVATISPTLEAAGFDGAYTFEGQSDPFIALSAAAMATKKMTLMTSIAVAFSRNPMSLAYLSNDLQVLSDGRFVLGLGTQVKAHIERRFSMPWSKPAARMREMVQAFHAIWDSWEHGSPLQFEGEFYTHTLMSPTFTPVLSEAGRPPIYLAGVGPLMTQVAGEVGDGYFVHPFHTEDSYHSLSLPALEKGWAKSGRNADSFTVSAQLITASGLNEESLQTAIDSARNQIAFYASTPAYLPVLSAHGWEALHEESRRLIKAGDWAALGSLVNDEMLNAFAVVGSPK